MSYSRFLVERYRAVARVSFNNPAKSNALDRVAWDEMTRIFEMLSGDKGVRVVVLEGEGRHWCAGIDLGLLTEVSAHLQLENSSEKEASLKSFIRYLQAAVNAVERCRVPVIASLHGGCLGAGLDIATACDMRFATEDAFFSVRETAMGLVADLGSLQRLPRIIPYQRAAQMAYTGEDLQADRAHDWGLIGEIFPDKNSLNEYVNGLAERIASHSPRVIAGIKRTLIYSRDHGIRDGLDWVAEYNSRHLSAEDITESMKARIEKRPPEYPDQL